MQSASSRPALSAAQAAPQMEKLVYKGLNEGRGGGGLSIYGPDTCTHITNSNLRSSHDKLP